MNNSTESFVIVYPREATIFASVCAICFCIVGVLGNFITILALLRSPKLKSQATTAFVLSLCLSDLLFSCVNLPLMASRYINEAWTLGDTLCKVYPVLLYGNVAVSLLNMVAITVNRYILISYYYHYAQLYSILSIWIQLVFCWGFAFFMMLPPLLGVWGQLGLNPSTFSCTILPKNNKSPKKAIFLFGFVLPCIVIIVSYSCIYWKVRKSEMNLRRHTNPQNQMRSRRRTNREKEDRHLTKLMLVIFICFLLCFLPLMLVNVFDDGVNYPVFHVSASILAWASSVINPFIYAGSNSQYREAYIKLFVLIKSGIYSSERDTNSKFSARYYDNNPNTQSISKKVSV